MSGYSEGGASRESKILRNWTPRALSAASDIDLNLELLRNRAADLARNTAIGHAAISTSARATIGSGLKMYPRPDCRALGISASEGREWSRRVSEEFRMWTEGADFYRRNNFGDLQYIAYTSYLTDGDVFCAFRRALPSARNPYTLRLQLLEANRISTPQDGTFSYNRVEGRAPNGNRIINGIEVDEEGVFRAVHVSNRLSEDLIGRDKQTEWVRIEAFGRTGAPNILQVAHDERPEQYRGVPYLASVIEPLKQTSRYTTAELAGAIVKSFFSLFFVQPNQNFDINETLNEEDFDLRGYRLGSGTLHTLPRGVDVKTVGGSQGSSGYGEFMKELVRQIGASVGLPYEVLMKSFESSYSASRAALLQANDEFKQRREWFIRDFCRPIYEQFLIEGIGLGRIEARGFFEDGRARQAWSLSDWYGPAMSVLDPLKEQRASEMRVQAGYSTRQRESAELTGSDYEANKEQQEGESDGQRDAVGEDQGVFRR